MLHNSGLRAGILFAVVAAIGLGAITTQAKLVFGDGGNAITLMVFRFVLSSLLIGLLLSAKGISLQIAKGTRLDAILLGVVWSAAMIAYLMSVQQISVSLAVLILYSYPIMVLLVGMFTGKVAVSFFTLAVFLAAFIGLCLALSGDSVELNIPGISLAFIAAVGAAFTFLRGASVATRLDPMVLTFWVNAIGILLILPLVVGEFRTPQGIIGWLALGGATAFYVIAILCQFQALARLPAATAAFVFNMEPVVSLLLALLVLGERLGVWQWCGVVLVLAAMFANSVYGRRDSAS
jgi:drug/metabolite transporter (DMT)-like permease